MIDLYGQPTQKAIDVAKAACRVATDIRRKGLKLVINPRLFEPGNQPAGTSNKGYTNQGDTFTGDT